VVNIGEMTDTDNQCIICHEIVGLKIYPTQRCDCRQIWCYGCYSKYMDGFAAEKKCLMCTENYSLNPVYTLPTPAEMGWLDVKYNTLISCANGGCHWTGYRHDYVTSHVQKCRRRSIYCEECDMMVIISDHYVYCSSCPRQICHTKKQCSYCTLNKFCSTCKKKPGYHRMLYCRNCDRDIKVCRNNTIADHHKNCDFPPRYDPLEEGEKRAREGLDRAQGSPKRRKTTLNQ
jgi:hypothetical protein